MVGVRLLAYGVLHERVHPFAVEGVEIVGRYGVPVTENAESTFSFSPFSTSSTHAWMMRIGLPPCFGVASPSQVMRPTRPSGRDVDRRCSGRVALRPHLMHEFLNVADVGEVGP